jgi:hypothetical protein
MSSSYKNVWIVEDVNTDPEILWNKPCRFRLLGSNTYLSMVSESEENSSQLELTENKQSETTMFAFVPFNMVSRVFNCIFQKGLICFLSIAS